MQRFLSALISSVSLLHVVEVRLVYCPEKQNQHEIQRVIESRTEMSET